MATPTCPALAPKKFGEMFATQTFPVAYRVVVSKVSLLSGKAVTRRVGRHQLLWPSFPNLLSPIHLLPLPTH